MAYETLLHSEYDPWQEAARRGDMLEDEFNGTLTRPYVGEDTLFHEEDLGIAPPDEEAYDPLTASFDTLVSKEYDSFEAYRAAPTIWDRQAEQAYLDQRAHGEALARTIAFQSMKRVSEYRAHFPKDTDTLQLRLVEPEPSSVDVALAELEQLRKEIDYELHHPPEPWYGHTQPLHTKKYEAPAAAKAEAVASVGVVFEGEPAEEPAGIWRIAYLSKRGAKRFIDRVKHQGRSRFAD